MVAGGWTTNERLSTIEVMNTDCKQWYSGPPTPIPWNSMKTAMVEGVAYFMGGLDYTKSATEDMYCVKIQTLISHITSKASRGTENVKWKVIPRLNLTLSTPLSIRGSLLSVGGKDKDGKAVTTISLYQPDREEWVKVGDLPSPYYRCTCAMTTDREIIVAGGPENCLKKTHFALLV